MTYSAPPTFTVNEVLTSTDMNTISGDITALAAAGFPIGRGDPLVGTAPVAGPGFTWQAGVLNTTTSGAGVFGLTFPAAFTSGVLGVWLNIAFLGGTQTWLAELTTCSTTGYAGTLISTAGTTINSTFVSICWFAIGF